ncbi:9164_t:CDS:2 [Entrophospora sp. SA101]|nr:9164_t:CDS:2 [Entrophospora sp. SA101]
MTGGSLRHRNLGVGDIGNAVDTVVDDHNYRNSRSRQKRQSLASRLIRLFIWTVLASLIFLLFNVPDQDNLLKFSSVCLSLTFINYIFLEYIQPFMKNTQKPNYKYWQQDKNLKKYIILATITGTVGLTGMSVNSDSTTTSETIMAVQQFSPVLISAKKTHNQLECGARDHYNLIGEHDESDYDINLDEEDHEPHEEIGKALVKVSSSIKYFILNGQSLRSSPGTIEVW